MKISPLVYEKRVKKQKPRAFSQVLFAKTRMKPSLNGVAFLPSPENSGKGSIESLTKNCRPRSLRAPGDGDDRSGPAGARRHQPAHCGHAVVSSGSSRTDEPRGATALRGLNGSVCDSASGLGTHPPNSVSPHAHCQLTPCVREHCVLIVWGPCTHLRPASS